MKMMHSGLKFLQTATMDTLSTSCLCILLLIQLQTFQALPTSSSSTFPAQPQRDTKETAVLGVSSSSTVENSGYPYSSYPYRAGLDFSYRPYSDYSKDSSLSGTNAPEAAHPNSVYSRQSLPSSISKSLEKPSAIAETKATDLQQQLRKEKQVTFRVPTNEKTDSAPEEKTMVPALSISSTSNNNNIKNKPRLRPLPSVSASSTLISADTATNDNKYHQKEQGNNKDQPEQQQYHPEPISRSEEFSPIPPPFAPELDPGYQRSQYGLGALTLLDQAGPFW